MEFFFLFLFSYILRIVWKTNFPAQKHFLIIENLAMFKSFVMLSSCKHKSY